MLGDGDQDLLVSTDTVFLSMPLGPRVPAGMPKPMVHRGFANASAEIYNEVGARACLFMHQMPEPVLLAPLDSHPGWLFMTVDNQQVHGLTWS